MDKSSVYEKFTGYVEQLRNTECSQKQKIGCFQHIAECIMSPAMAGHINYSAHCGTATNVLLLFCEDLDSVVRMSAEENLNKIFRALEKTRVSRILMDLYGEIKRNGNQRSLRICLNLFSYYAPQIKEKHIKWYAVRLLQCMSIISQRKETLLQETLCDFVKHFGRYVQQGLNDSETCKIFEIFLSNVSADCAVKRRCSAQNCISLIEHARNKSLMAKHGLNKIIDLLLTDQQTNAVLGALGLLRLLLPQLIRGYSADYNDDGDSLASGAKQRSTTTSAAGAGEGATTAPDCRKIIEIYDYCLHLLSTQHTANHAIINAALETINAILQTLDATPWLGKDESLAQSLRELLCNQQLQHTEYLRRRKSLKNQIFQLKNFEVATIRSQQQQHSQQQQLQQQSATAGQMQMQKNSNAKLQQHQQQECQHQQQQQQQQQSGNISWHAVGINAVSDEARKDDAASGGAADEGKKSTHKHFRNAARSISECVDDDDGDDDEEEEDEDEDVELLGADECDDFTTLSQLNEPQQTLSTAVTLLTTKVDVAATDKLIDAATEQENVNVDVDAEVLLPKPQAVQHQSSLQNLLASDDKSQHLSDIDNESFNSIDFDAEITIAGGPNIVSGERTAEWETSNATSGGSADSTAIGTFFNNLLSHSNAASESVSKLFRQSSGAKSTSTKALPGADKTDATSTASLTLSLSSLASSNVGAQERQSSINETPTPLEDSYSATASYTASTAVLVDAPVAIEGEPQEQQEEAQMRRTPNANPFLVENSPLKQTISGHALISLKIGSIFEQSLVHYTARLLSARFLLTGQPCGLQPDSVTRVSIKSLSLCVLAQCVRLAPRILQLQVEISEAELQLLEQHTASDVDSAQASSAGGSPCNSDNSQLGADYEQLEATAMTTAIGASLLLEEEQNEMLLDIKDDHFGASTCQYLQQPPLSRSADAALLQQQLDAGRALKGQKSKVATAPLSKSEIIGSNYRVTVATEDAPPLGSPPRPPKRTKSIRKSNTAFATTTPSPTNADISQALADVLLYYAHSDPILRGGVQQIVGNFVQASAAGLAWPLKRNLCLQHLLAILLKGFEDDIHTVVIQALNAFDKIFPHVVSKYLTGPPCHYHAHQQQQKQQQRQASAQQKRPAVDATAPAQTFGKQTFAKGQDNALSSQQHQQHQHQERQQQTEHLAQQRGSNDGILGQDGEAASLNMTTTATLDAAEPAASRTNALWATDNDELVTALLNDFQLQSNCKSHQHHQHHHHYTESSSNEAAPFCVFAISPKLLLNKLRLCHHNKYWLVQNKYAEVISNLNYVLLRSYYENAVCDFDNNNSSEDNNDGVVESANIPVERLRPSCNLNVEAHDEDIVCTYEAQFLSELLHLLGDDDARVREHAAACLCRFIMQTARQQKQQQQQPHNVARNNATAEGGNGGLVDGGYNINAETQQTNFNLLWDFFDYRIFGSMSMTLRNLFRPSATISPPLADLDAAATTTATANAASTGDAMISAAASSMMMMMGPGAAMASAYFDGSGGGWGSYAVDGQVLPFQRQIAHEEKVLVKVLYRMTNKLMALNDKNAQFGIIYALRLLLKHFNFVDHHQAWIEFNFIEICISYAYYNNATAADLNCQNDLIDVMGKLIAGAIISGHSPPSSHLDFLLGHTLKVLNIYYHVVSNQRPLQQSATRGHKTSELFTLNSSTTRDLAMLQALGYFGNDYVYMKLYNILRGANDSYKISINHEAGNLLICLLKTSLNALSLCLELRAPENATTATTSTATTTTTTTTGATTTGTTSKAAGNAGASSSSSSPALKLIEEILHYLTKLINYAPGECVACLRQLLKYLFAQNYGSRLQQRQQQQQQQQQQQLSGDCYNAFICSYFAAKRRSSTTINSEAVTVSPVTQAMTTCTSTQNLIEAPIHVALGALFAQGLQLAHPPADGNCVRLIKLFEPLVIYCLTLFLKSNAQIQAPILELLSQLLELNVTYSILDSKNVIFEQILNNLDLIENGIDRNAYIIVPPMLQFLMQLTHKSDRQLITIPKIISITNNLLANGAVRDVALLALKTLSYELFFMPSPVEDTNLESVSCPTPLTGAITATDTMDLQVQLRELDTQKEVVLGMLEKFIEARSSQQVLALLLLYERSVQQFRASTAVTDASVEQKMNSLSKQDADAIYAMLCRTLCAGHLRIQTPGDLRLLECCFRNNGNNVLSDSKEFLQLLQLFIEQDVGNYGDLAHATIILANVILKTEEIYLVNHIKLYLKNNPTAELRLQQSAAVTTAAVTATTTTPPLHWLDATPSTSSAAAAARAAAVAAATATATTHITTISEINYFAKVLCEKLLACCDALLDLGPTPAATLYCSLAARFVNALHNVCCRSRHKDALQSVFRLVLAESEFLCKYYNLLLMSADCGGGSGEALDSLLLACLQLLLAMRMLEPLALLAQAAQLRLKWSMQRALLREVCRSSAAQDWMPQQVRRLCADKYLNFLIADHLQFLCELCQVRPECGSLLKAALLQSAHRLNKHSIRGVLRLLWHLGQRENQAAGDAGGDPASTQQTQQLLERLHQLHDGQRELQRPIERLAQRLRLKCALAEAEEVAEEADDEKTKMAATSRIIDESWLFAQLIKFATQHRDAAQQQQQLMRMLLDIQSEAKLQRLFRSMGAAHEARLLRHALEGSVASMLAAFRQNCIQHTPHINYMQPPPLARVACALLMARVAATSQQAVDEIVLPITEEQLEEARALTTLVECTRRLETTALIYIDARFVDKFVREHFLREEHVPNLLAYLSWLATRATRLLQWERAKQQDIELALPVLLGCIEMLLQHPQIWRELNVCEGGLRRQLLAMLSMAARLSLQQTIFYQRHRRQEPMIKQEESAMQAIFLAKLIEAQIDIEALQSGEVFNNGSDAPLQFSGYDMADIQVPLLLITSIGISLLRTHEFYAIAVTPHEVILQQQREQQVRAVYESPVKRPTVAPTNTSSGKLPTIPVDNLSDVDVLRKFVNALFIFGFTTRQQFEEYFMTFLLLINKQYDEHMVDRQEQFQIKQVCLQAIMELLMTYKTFPIVGSSGVLSANPPHFHHTTRWTRINCDSISLKKLHKVQLLIAGPNVFYQPNLERQLMQDNVIGTRNFAANQYDLNFCWALMDVQALPAPSTPNASEDADRELGRTDYPWSSGNVHTDTAMRNYYHFTQLSGIDIRSTTQLVYDMLQQMIEQNHILGLPHLLKFCEICENRDQIKWIKERALKLQEQIPMDDTISHQHLIYLLCRTQSLLIPSHGELQHLCTLIGNFYLKSSHCFIRNATLSGLLCLLECCSKTNTTIGKLSEELALLRDLIVGYINRHGIIDESPLLFSDTHTMLVWTLNYSLIEWTSKFVPQCHLLSNTIIAANKLLKTTNNEEIYLCVLHGLERMVVNSGNVAATPTSESSGSGGHGGGSGGGGGGIGIGVGGGAMVTPQLRHKIEKLALELLKMENEKFSIPALKLLLSCMYVGSAKQLENTELSNGIVQDDPEIIAQQNDKVDILLHCIKSSTRDAAWIYGQVLCQIIRDLVPPNEILTKVIKEFLAINQPHGDVIAMIVYQVFRSAIDSSFLQMLQDWLICTLPTFLAQPEEQGVWGLSVIFLSASINLHLIKLFPLLLGIGAAATPSSILAPAATSASAAASASATVSVSVSAAPRKLGQHEIALFVTAAQDFHAKLSGEQKVRFREAFRNFEQHQVYAKMLERLG
ncbi:uncharacterized protein LOC115621948 [Scaptodrosophila lebanonensis]|uniref:Uncharacterized protein LOC115621948 n=1 Tax=Drosophila lebanonensis TaxID=7225 RepID=A0A6J2T8N2_DROLE|nr:uncharacterized protein LOC115621948 [Scaptodrosophila lebanonensis]